MTGNIRILYVAIISVLAIAALACQTVDQENATATAETLGDRQVSKRAATSGAPSTPTPVRTGSIPIPATTTSVPSTATPKPVVSGPWITALQAVDIVTKEQSGVVRNVVAHVARKVGQFDSGDLTGATPSPGPGYSAMWEVSMSDGDDLYLCQVWSRGTNCDSLFRIPDGNVEGASIDSTTAFANWSQTAEWTELIRNEDVSVLMVLKPSNGEDSPQMWECSVTVHNATSGLRGGNFVWIPETGESSFTTY